MCPGGKRRTRTYFLAFAARAFARSASMETSGLPGGARLGLLRAGALRGAAGLPAAGALRAAGGPPRGGRAGEGQKRRGVPPPPR